MLSKLLSNVLVTLLSNLASKGWRALIGYIERRKRNKKSQEVAERVENAKSPNDIRDSVDDLP